MIIKGSKLLATIFLLFSLSIFIGTFASAATTPIIEVGKLRTLGEQAKAPILLRNTSDLTSAYFEFSIQDDANGVSIANIEASPLFNSRLFNTKVAKLSDTKAKIDIHSTTDKEQKLPKEVAIVGYLTLNLTEDFKPGQTITIQISDKAATGRKGSTVDLTAINGEILRKMTIGDIVGKNEVTAAGAMRIFQHVNGTNLITEREQQLSADVNADGRITQEDAFLILDYVSGKRLTFFTVEAKELANAVLGNDYNEQILATYGREPYTYKKVLGTLPSGIKLNEATGELYGKPTKVGSYSFTIQATDAVGNMTEGRLINMNVIDSNIAKVTPLDPVYVKLGETPNLPPKVSVTYKDKTTGQENVTWDAVDTSVLGKTLVKGKVGESGYTVLVEVLVIDKDYIKNINVGYFELLNTHIHTIEVDVTKDVYAVTINGIETHYEGNNRFSLGTPSFPTNSIITLSIYDKYGNLLETKSHKLVVNK